MSMNNKRRGIRCIQNSLNNYFFLGDIMFKNSLIAIAFVSTFHLTISMDHDELIENAATPLHSFLCENLDDTQTPVPNDMVKHLIEIMKSTHQSLAALARIKDMREKKPYKDYQFYPNPESKRKQTNIRMIRATKLVILFPCGQYRIASASLYEFAHTPEQARHEILPIGIIDTSRNYRINFIDQCSDSYPGLKSWYFYEIPLDLGGYPFEKDKDFCWQGSITYESGAGATTYNLLRLLVQCDRISVLNQLFSACNNPPKQVSSWWDWVLGTSKIDLGRQFHEQLTRYHQNVALNGSHEDKEQIIKLLKAIKEQI